MIGTERFPSVRIALPSGPIMPRFTPFIPGRQIRKSDWLHLRGLELADLCYDRPATVDAILGADVYEMLFESGVRRGPLGESAVVDHFWLGSHGAVRGRGQQLNE